MYIIASLIGICTGIMSGFLGIGGAILMIPSLVIFLKFSQHMSQGTALAAMIPPIGILAAFEYYKSGNVDIRIALLISAGFIIGAYAGAKFVAQIDDILLRKIFGVVLLVVSIFMIFKK